MTHRVRTSMARMLVMTSIALTGCDSGDAPFIDPLLNEPPPVITGTGLLGIISGGIVTALVPSDRSVLAEDITQADGSFSLELPLTQTGPVLIEITPAIDGSSTFLCDFPTGCPDPNNTGALITFGDNVPYISTLSAATANARDINDVNINPITSAIVARSVELGGVTEANLAQANNEMSEQLTMLLGIDFPVDISTVPNINLVSPATTSADPLVQAGILLASVNAGLISLVNTDETLEDVIADLVNGFAPDGELGPGASFNSGELGSPEILFAAQQTIAATIANQPAIVEVLELAVPSLNLANTTISLQMMRNAIAPIPPMISGSPESVATEDAVYSFTPAVIDEDDTSFSFNVANLPTWASFDATNGAISGIPVNADVGVTNQTSISVSDGFSITTLGPFAITVENTNDAPVLTGSPATTVAESSAYQFAPSATDEDTGTTLSFSISPATLPAWLSFNAQTGVLSGIPQDADVGSISNIVISVSDGEVTTSLGAFSLTVANLPPSISGTPGAAMEDSAFSFTPSSAGGNNFSVNNLPSWAAFDSATGTIAGIPTNSDVNIYTGIEISLSDLNETVVLSGLTIEVINTNDAPVISGSPATGVLEDAVYSFQPNANDIDVGDNLSFSISSTPVWANFNSATGELSGTPINDNVGVYNDLIITVSDSSNEQASLAPFTVTVTNTNDIPTVTGTPATSVTESSAYLFAPIGADVDTEDTITYSVTLDQTLPAWLSFSTTTGQLTGTPGDADVTTLTNLLIRVTDLDGEFSVLAPFDLTIVNVPPTLSGTFPNAVEDTPYTFTFASTGSASFEVLTTQLPSWATLNTATGEVSGTPANDDVGTTTNISITASDATDNATLQNLSLSVINTNDAPTISGTPPSTVLEDSRYSFVPLAADVDVGDSLTYSISAMPTWATFSSSTGVLTGTPDNSDVGIYSNIIVSVIDTADSSAQLETFSIDVINTNDAPTITGVPTTGVLENDAYNFTPISEDVDIIYGDSISFSITL
ncbi:MAG: hypothetical protein ACJAVI_000158, partial [Candidatus Azotimanducaceae bacterium]